MCQKVFLEVVLGPSKQHRQGLRPCEVTAVMGWGLCRDLKPPCKSQLHAKGSKDEITEEVAELLLVSSVTQKETRIHMC